MMSDACSETATSMTGMGREVHCLAKQGGLGFHGLMTALRALIRFVTGLALGIGVIGLWYLQARPEIPIVSRQWAFMAGLVVLTFLLILLGEALGKASSSSVAVRMVPTNDASRFDAVTTVNGTVVESVSVSVNDPATPATLDQIREQIIRNITDELRAMERRSSRTQWLLFVAGVLLSIPVSILTN